jgi:5-methylcytosine-specific restriction endonuclease McrA
MAHPNAGRKQSCEHVAKRVEATRLAKSLWDSERITLNRQRISESAKGRASWLKGKKDENYPEYLRAINSECHKGIQAGEKHPMFGKHHLEESKKKNAEKHLGIKQSAELIAKRVAARAGYHHSPLTKAKIGKANSGTGNGNWLGGITRYHGWSFSLREEIRERDGRKCRVCRKAENGKRHDVHHIDYDKKNITPDNLVSLCRYCHGKTNHNRDQWQTFFTQQNNIPLTGTNNIRRI